MHRIPAIVAVLLLTSAIQARSQDPDPSPWTWSTDANVFIGYNYQQRLFADFSAWESQNWIMVDGSRWAGPGRLTVDAMLSLEPLTVGHLVYAGGQRLDVGGSPQLFQTGESYQQTPLVNIQHPHDFVMGLGVRYHLQRERLAYSFTAALVGSPALGPTAFMHRESARDNPEVPLAHHSLDSTHITPGVVTAGIEADGFTVEASTFRGEEPDENRWNIERPRLDSWSARVGYQRGAWQAQVSGGHLHEPEWFEPYDETRLTASVSFDGALAGRPLAATAAWGRNIEYNGFNDRADQYLTEWDFRARPMDTVYGRFEFGKKQIFGLGYHPKGFNHPHAYSKIGALTVGYVRDVVVDRHGRFGVGADVTGYRSSADLTSYYDGSHSFNVFLRWRPNRSSMGHVH